MLWNAILHTYTKTSKKRETKSNIILQSCRSQRQNQVLEANITWKPTGSRKNKVQTTTEYLFTCLFSSTKRLRSVTLREKRMNSRKQTLDKRHAVRRDAEKNHEQKNFGLTRDEAIKISGHRLCFVEHRATSSGRLLKKNPYRMSNKKRFNKKSRLVLQQEGQGGRRREILRRR